MKQPASTARGFAACLCVPAMPYLEAVWAQRLVSSHARDLFSFVAERGTPEQLEAWAAALSKALLAGILPPALITGSVPPRLLDLCEREDRGGLPPGLGSDLFSEVAGCLGVADMGRLAMVDRVCSTYLARLEPVKVRFCPAADRRSV